MKRVFDEFHFFAVGVVRHIHYGVFDAIGIGDLVKNEAFPFAGALHVDIAEIQDGWEKSLDLARRVLDTEEENFAHMADEETSLLDVDDALIGDDPDIEVIVDPSEETEEPEKDKERVFDEEKERPINATQKLRIEEPESDEGADDGDESQQKRDELHENIEPMPVNDEENFFVGVLPFEVKSSVEIFSGNHHREKKMECRMENMEYGRND